MNEDEITTRARFILKIRWLLLGLIIGLFYFTPSSTRAGSLCKGENFKIYSSSIVNPVDRSIKAGTQIGTINFSGEYDCEEQSTNIFTIISFLPNTAIKSSIDNVCTTNIPGIGIRYRYSNNPTRPTCSNNNYITVLNKEKGTQLVNEKFAELVFTGEEPPLPGSYFIDLSGVIMKTDSGYADRTGINPMIPLTLAGAYPKILFPGYAASNPVVDLDIRFNRGNNSHMTASSEKNLDICFYDGLDSSSTSMNIYFTDNSGSGRDFNVKLNGQDSTDISKVIPYNISLKNPTTGAFIPVSNGQAFNWSNTDELKNPRKQLVSGANGLSSCVLSSIKFSTPSFNFSNKVNGLYSGQLSVIFTPST